MLVNLIILSVLTVLAVGLIVYSLWPKSGIDAGAVKRRLGGRRGTDEEALIRDQAKATASNSIVRKATPMFAKLVMPVSEEQLSNLRLKLANAGFRQPQAQTLFLGSKTFCALVGLVLGLFAAIAYGWSATMIASAAAFAAGAGLMIPDFWLSMSISSRQQKIRHGLPDTLDLLVVSVESGLALDAAFKRVGEEMSPVHPELSEELRIATAETQMGIRRNESLENMARRTGLDEVRNLVSVVVQAEKFGTSIARALRNQADALRVKRRQAAEEKAQKTAVKLMIPLVLFIFPAIGVVVAGPAAISAVRAWQENPNLGG
ncbi:MAG: type II secretion system F family protein [Phycisphaerales bacterium]|nr:type II secretion system F family protein [Phycisphaerales bacterium]